MDLEMEIEMAVFFKQEIPVEANRQNSSLYDETEEQLKERPGEPAIVAVVDNNRDRNRWLAAGRERKWKVAQRVFFEDGERYWNIWAWWPLEGVYPKVSLTSDDFSGSPEEETIHEGA